MRIQKVLTENERSEFWRSHNGKEFTDRLFGAQHRGSGNHEFDQLCQARG
jgi:hypothetical protein